MPPLDSEMENAEPLTKQLVLVKRKARNSARKYTFCFQCQQAVCQETKGRSASMMVDFSKT